MKKPDVVLVFALSQDGIYKPTKGEFIPSPEDQSHFREVLASADATIMGRDTAEQNLVRIKKGLRPGLLRLGLTHHPELFAHDQVPGMLEFKNLPSEAAVKYLTSIGKQRIVVLSGGPANELIPGKTLTEAHITVEPVILGKGLKLQGWEEKPKQLRAGYPVKLNNLNNIGTQLSVFFL